MCKEDKQLEEFHLSKRPPSFRQPYCKLCSSIRRKQYYADHREHEKKGHTDWYANNKDIARNSNLKRYGINHEDYTILYQKQNGKCAICFCQKETLHVDHDHESGQIRGLLCFHCNTLLGKAFDNIEVLTSAINYLIQSNVERHQAKERKTNDTSK